MDAELTPDEIRELLGAYALDAVDPDERAKIERALLEDHDTRREAYQLQLARAWLVRSAPRPPVEVWERITAAIEAERVEEPDLTPTNVVRAAAFDRPRISRRRDAGMLRRALAIAAAIVAFAFVSVTVVDTLTDSGTNTPSALAQAVKRSFADPDARQLALQDARGTAVIDVAVLPDGQGYMKNRAAGKLPAGRTYQLWAITDAGPVSITTMGPNPSIGKFQIPDATGALAVTNEPRGGSQLPTGSPLASVSLVA